MKDPAGAAPRLAAPTDGRVKSGGDSDGASKADAGADGVSAEGAITSSAGCGDGAGVAPLAR
jgi:hypothetical protein